MNEVRKFVQITTNLNHEEAVYISALASDGTIWSLNNTKNKWRYVGCAPQVEKPELTEGYKGELLP